MTTTSKIRHIIAKYNATGQCAYYHPRKHTISLGGSRAIPEAEAVNRMLKTIRESKA